MTMLADSPMEEIEVMADSDMEQMIALVRDVSTTAAETRALGQKLESIDSAMTRWAADAGARDAAIEARLTKLETWQARMMGVAFGIGLVASVIGSVITALWTGGG